ncbi:hypothetical protein Mapa_008217 [Marchantia paleacea]|nr:hypothetical protein Mapa_008217 [Marchantia paleacea]
MGSATVCCSSLLSTGTAAFPAEFGNVGSSRIGRRKIKAPSVAVRFASNQDGSGRCGRSAGGQRWDSYCHGDSVLRSDQALESVSSQSEKALHSMSKGGLAVLIASSLGYTICDNVLAAVEAAPVPQSSTNLMFIIACVAEALALTGAVVGGVLARQRKLELEKINSQLRQINVNLRRQSRVESYAPNLTYAPVGSGRVTDVQVREDPVREELMQSLKAGKRWLREQKPVNAFREFEKALPLAKQLKDTVEEKKAARGLGASCQRQGKYKEAIKYHTMVLTISHMTRESSGNTEAYGAIADCYTELGDLETAGKFYDKYIDGLEQDD